MAHILRERLSGPQPWAWSTRSMASLAAALAALDRDRRFRWKDDRREADQETATPGEVAGPPCGTRAPLGINPARNQGQAPRQESSIGRMISHDYVVEWNGKPVQTVKKALRACAQCRRIGCGGYPARLSSHGCDLADATKVRRVGRRGRSVHDGRHADRELRSSSP
jgi:hypothetical protein